MARAYGANTQLVGKFESSYGTPPSGNYNLLPFVSSDLGSEQGLIASDLLGQGREERRRWIPIEHGEEKFGDVVVLRMRGQPIHVGLVIEKGRMLHAEVGIGSVLDSYASARWVLRVTGFYRYGERPTDSLADGLS